MTLIKKKTILFIDNRRSFLDVQAELLEYEGYRVVKAYSLEKASEQLAQRSIHLVISDIRMVDDDDPEDASGLIWIRDQGEAFLPTIVLTAHKEEYIGETLDLVLGRASNIVSYAPKQAGPEKLHLEVKDAFAKMDINWDLNVRWNPQHSPPHLVSLIEPDIDPRIVHERVHELQDLLGKLFADFFQITFGRIISSNLGHVLVEGFAYDQAQRETQYILSFGQRAILHEENDRNKNRPNRQGDGHTRLVTELGMVETYHYALTSYELVGGDLQSMGAFALYYQHNSDEKVCQVLDNLFKQTLSSWNTDGLRSERCTFRDFMPDLSAIDVDVLMAKMTSIQQQAFMSGFSTFKKRNGSIGIDDYYYPLLHADWLNRLPEQEVIYGTIHGGLNGNVVLVNDAGITWVVDFLRSGVGALIWDYAVLESHIKFDQLQNVGVRERHMLEKRLLALDRLNDQVDVSGLSGKSVKALNVVAYLRRLAAARIGSSEGTYLWGLLAYALEYVQSFDEAIRYTKNELEPFAHAVLVILMIGNDIERSGKAIYLNEPTRPKGELHLDTNNRTLRIDDFEISLTRTEFELMDYLYENKNFLCTRDSIAQVVWGEDEEPPWSRSRLDTTISRLRRKLEDVTGTQKYIATVQGQGFKLVPRVVDHS